MRIGFIHPDLGIGGAEQLIVNLALALKNNGHSVKIYTPYHNKTHCFKETIDGSLSVQVAGNCFPRNFCGKGTAICAYIRMILAAIYVILFGGHFDVIIVDQVSVCVPILRLFNRKVLFYCHFPDKLLCVERKSRIKRVYRYVLDTLEEITLIPANIVLVNSKFTKEIFAKSFPNLKRRNIIPRVLYPAIDFSKFDESVYGEFFDGKFFLSLNRYEKKKNINLAIKAYAEFLKLGGNSEIKLIIAGGYDPRINENKNTKIELENLTKELEIEKQVIFKTSISNEERIFLLQNAFAVLYTPENEHFGIVPIEAMYMKSPVIACNSGGPLESVSDCNSGFLLKSDYEIWASKMKFISENCEKRKEMGSYGKKHVKNLFGFESFGIQANKYICEITRKKNKIE